MTEPKTPQAFEAPDPIDRAVGDRIRVRRKWLGVSQSELANALGVSFQQVQKYERGSNRVSASTLVRTAERLEMTVAELVGEAAVGRTDDDMFAKLAIPGATELLAAYSEVDRPELRAAVLNLVRSVAAAE